MLLSHFFEPIECTPRVNPKVSYELWEIIMCQCRFILDKNCTTLVSHVDSGEAVHVGGSGVYGTSLYLLLIFIEILKLL